MTSNLHTAFFHKEYETLSEFWSLGGGNLDTFLSLCYRVLKGVFSLSLPPHRHGASCLVQSFLSVTLGKGNEWQTSHCDQEGRSALAAPSSASSPGASTQHYFSSKSFICTWSWTEATFLCHSTIICLMHWSVFPRGQ